MSYRRYGQPADRSWIVLVIIVILMITSTAGLVYFLAPTLKQSVRYVAVVNVQESNERTEYNVVNIIKDGALIAGASAGLATCIGGTFGACVAAVPAVAAALKGVLDDEIMTVKADFTFVNVGNGTARNMTYDVAIYSDSKLVKTDTFKLQDLEPGKSIVTEYSHKTTLADIAVSAWDSIQGKGKITLHVVNVSYDGGA